MWVNVKIGFKTRLEKKDRLSRSDIPWGIEPLTFPVFIYLDKKLIERHAR